MKQHISKVASIVFYHLRHLKKVWSILGSDITTSLVSDFILNRPNYCIMVLANLPASTIAPRRHDSLKVFVHAMTWHQHYETYTGCLFGTASCI